MSAQQSEKTIGVGKKVTFGILVNVLVKMVNI